MKLIDFVQKIPFQWNRSVMMEVIRAICQQVDGLSEGRVSAYHGQMTAPPTSGTWVRGDWVKNSLPSTTGYFGWICVDSGTPGTWAGFGLIP